MSFRRNSAKVTKDGDTSKDTLFNNGMKANKFFTRSGFASAMDSQLLKKNIEDYQRALGEGSYSIKVVDAKGDAVADPVLNIGGRTYFANGKGVHTIVDKKYMEEELKRAEEVEEYLNEMVEYASASDVSLAKMLNEQMNTVKEICETGGYAAKITNNDTSNTISKDIDAVNCLPSVMRLYSKESLVFAQAVAKLRAILMTYAPILDDAGTSKALREEGF